MKHSKHKSVKINTNMTGFGHEAIRLKANINILLYIARYSVNSPQLPVKELSCFKIKIHITQLSSSTLWPIIYGK